MMTNGTFVDEQAGIYLRLMTEDDTDLIVKWRNLEEVRCRFIYRERFTREGHLHWIHSMIDTGKAVQMMICTVASDEPVGSVYIRDIDPIHKKGEYGIFIGEESARGKGIGSAAAVLMIRYAFETIGLHKIYLRVFADNPGAIRSYEKAGFKQEGYLRDEVWVNGSYQDMIWMAVRNISEAKEKMI
jgi:UDP-4-amino-4,6-dideoxy-N-acetyl-beta-L-altrosamine N-acetyltransferase